MTMSERRKRNPDALSKVFYKTGRAKAAFKAIDDLIREGWEVDYCRAQVILGMPGTGKTHILRNYQDSHLDTVRMLKLEVGPKGDLPSFVTDLLIALKDPAPVHGTVAERTRRVSTALEKFNPDLLAFEEFHRLIDGKTDRVNDDVGKWITGFLNRCICPVLLVGEPSGQRVLATNEMLDQRCFPLFELSPFDWGVPADRTDFRAIMHAIDGALGFGQPSGLSSADTAQRIYAYCRGRIRLAVDLVAEARRLARSRELPCLNHEIFALAVDKSWAGKSGLPENPFRTEKPPKAEPAPDVPDEPSGGPGHGNFRLPKKGLLS
jgi:hypothetical protein